jgi:RimJ/RimL family protein N-acetyltransferase
MDARDIITTKRLVLRPIRLADAPAMQRIFPQPEIVQYLTTRVPWPYPPDGAETFLREKVLPNMAAHKEWMWAITLKGGDATLIGVIHLLKDGVMENENRGFWIAPEYQKQGYVTEAVLAVNDYAFNKAGFEKLTISNAKANIGSSRIKQKTGMRRVGEKMTDFISGRLPSEIWEITKEEWEAWKRAN